MRWTSFKTIGHSSNNLGPSQKTLRPSWCPKLFFVISFFFFVISVYLEVFRNFCLFRNLLIFSLRLHFLIYQNNTSPKISPRVNFGVKICISPAFLSGKHPVHCLGRLEKHNTLGFSVLMFFPAWSGCTQHKTDQMRAEDPVEKIHACSVNSFAKSKSSKFCLKQTVHPAVPNSDTLIDASLTVYQIHID